MHPFDDPLVIAGAGTVGLEIEEDAPDADVVIVGVGGGGLVSGLRTALGDRIRVVAVEPEESQALHAGLAAGESDARDADLGRGRTERAVRRDACRSRSAATSNACSSPKTRSSDAFRFLYERAKLACEPAAAAATAAWLSGKVHAERPVLVVSGGNVAGQTAAAILARR